MASPDAYAKGFAAVATLVFALVLLASRKRRGPHLFLGAFLLLIAGNQAAETMRALAGFGTPAGARWWAAATVFAALDPLALYLFARSQARATRERLWTGVLCAGVAGALALLAIGMTPDALATRFVVAALGVFTALVYSLVFARFLRASAADPADGRMRTLAIACGLVMVLPLYQVPQALADLLVFGVLGHAASDVPSLVGALAWPALALGLAVGVLLAGRLPHPAAARRTALLALGLGFAVTAIVSAIDLLRVLALFGPIRPSEGWETALVIVRRASTAVRWLLFAGLVSAAVVRGDLLGLSLARRRLAARTVVALGMVGLVSLAYGLLATLGAPEDVEMRPLDWLLLLFALAATQGFRPLIDGVASRVYGVPMRADRSGAEETYRRAVLQAAAEGRDPHADPALARLRGELGLDAAGADLIARAAEETLAGPLVAGQRVAGRYRVLRLVGRGGAGRVFLARDEALGRDVVLKEVPHETPDDEAALREARVAGGLAHPNVVVVYDVVRRPGASLLVTEYLAGGSLADRVRAEGRLAPAEALRVLDGVLAGLEAVHARGVVHRDLKPHNVLLTTRGEPKIADFGIATARRGATARVDAADAFLGTPEFMAPEQREGGRSTPATDVYGVGRLARECCAAPFPAAVEDVVARALREAPEERWPDAAAMRRALAEAARVAA